MPQVNLLIKPASGMCNMQCDYCFYCDEAEKRKQASFGMMSLETAENVLRKTLRYADGSCTIAFQGGEPTLCGLSFYEHVVTFVEQYKRPDLQVLYALQTNGYAIDDAWCRFFKQHHFLVGLSVDGTEAFHDKYRHDHQGKGTYQRVCKAAELFDRYGVEYNILTVVHKDTAENIREIYKAYQRRGWKYLQFIACLDPLGEEKGQRPYSLLPETYGRFLIELFGLWYKDWRRGRQPYIRQFENYIGMLAGHQPESCEQRGICGIQHVVEADGSLYPCDFYALDELCLGNLNQNSMMDIQKERTRLGFVERSKNHSKACRACRWFGLCRGGCYRNREGDADNYFCAGYQCFFEQCYDGMVEIAKEITKK